MTKKSLLASIAALAAAGLVNGASAQNAGPANAPDFSSMTSAWLALGTDFKEVPGTPAIVTNDDAHPHVGNGGGKQSSFRFADLNNPNLTDFAKASLKKTNDEVLRGKAVFSREARCWPTGVPTYDLNQAQPVYFIQTPKEVTMIWQMDHQVRHIYLNVPHSANPKPSWYGESVGHYEGDTLVVDTIGIDTKTFVDNFETPHTEKLHTVERFRMTNGGMGMEVALHVEDEGAFTTPWNAIQRYKRVEPGVAEAKVENSLLGSTGDAGPILESSCAENPNGLFGAAGALPLPQTSRPDF